MFINSTPPPASLSTEEKTLPIYHLGQTAITSPKPIRNAEEIIVYAKKLPQEGVLKQGEGFLYIDLPEEYISDLLIILNEPGIEPPPYFNGVDDCGANICAILQEEITDLGSIEETGQIISFTITGSSSIKPYGWDGIDKVYLLTIESPELEKIRTKHGLTPKIDDHNFHIIFGVKKTKDSLSFDVSKLIADPATLSSMERV